MINNSEITKLNLLTQSDFELFVETTDLQKLHKIKLYLDNLYYNTGDSGLDDWKYDILKDSIITKDPNYKVPIGHKVDKNKQQLPFWLGSMDKISTQSPFLYYYKEVEKLNVDDIAKYTKTTWENMSDSERNIYQEKSVEEIQKEIKRWLNKNIAPRYTIQDKLDGVSCLLTLNNGILKLYTRGDGSVGTDISILSSYISGIPKNLDKNLSINIRGELIMKDSVFDKKYSGSYANARNLVAGLVGSKTLKDGIKDIEFIAYEIVDTGLLNNPSQQLETLQLLKFKTVRKNVVDNIDVNCLIKTFTNFKTKTKYQIDGIIVQSDKPYIRNTSGNPKYAFAFKMRFGDNIVKATVVDVEWNVSKRGKLKPRIKIKPIKLQGVTITYTTGFNAKFILENSIGKGAQIKITRSGDVIPYIVEVVKQAKSPQMPSIDYKWNETNVDILITKDNDEMCIKILSNFFSTMNIKFVGTQIINKLYDSGYDSLFKILEMSRDDLIMIEGIQQKGAIRIYDSIHNGLQNVSVSVLLSASSVFGFGIGTKKIEELFNCIPDLLTISKTMTKSEILDLVKNVEGYSLITAKKIVDNIAIARLFLKKIDKFVTFQIPQKQTTNQTFQNMKIVFSGFRDKDLEKLIVERGGKIVTSVSKKTDLVVTLDINSNTGKVKKARDLGVNIVDKKEFILQIN